MPFFKKSYDDMVVQGLQRLKNYSNITQLAPGAKARMILDSVYGEQLSQHNLFDANLSQAYLRWAEGRFLDFYGDMVDIPRLEATSATAEIEHNNFTWYASGTFGDINNQLDFVIPSGLITISTVEFPLPGYSNPSMVGTIGQQVVEYDLIENVTCRASDSFVYGSIRARVEGSVSDVPSNVLRKHNFTSYGLSARNLLFCTNKYAISNGRDRESDESYKYRLMNANKAREQGNRIACRLAALSVPGVADVTEFVGEQGPGTFSMYVQGYTPVISPNLTARAEDAVKTVCSLGVRPFLLAPNPVGLEFVLAVNWKSTATSSNQGAGYAAIRNTIEKALNITTTGGSVNLVDLANFVATSSSYIQSIGLARPGFFEEVYIYKSSADGLGVKKSLFAGDLVEPLYNERIMLETTTRYRGVKFL